ncbi:MAG: hypothetical protein JRH11_18975 [Deltaproteobacteria bacterium]|nr:hypothetical protein [Deltaproteobacteria bacterium]
MPRLSSVEEAVANAGTDRDAALRGRNAAWRERGVVHTPAEVARYVVSAVDRSLRERLGLAGGIANSRVALVDPACGPGAFLAAALTVAGRRRGAPGHFVGLDVDEGAVQVAREVLGPAAEGAGWSLDLDVGDTLASLTPFGHLEPDAVVVVVGNPPWASKSANRGAQATEALLEDFRRDQEGRRLDERKLGVLSDDYVRFVRWACEVVRGGGGGGVLGFTTNGSFIDGPVHRGMRGAMVRWFDGVDIVDLGGSALLSRTGEKDENVFGVRPSVALTVAHRLPTRPVDVLPGVRRARARHASIPGTRAAKLHALAESQVSFARVAAAGPMFLFKPTIVDARYEGWPSLDELFRFHAEGVQTNRDAAVIDDDPERLRARLTRFADGAHGAQDAQDAAGLSEDSSLAPALVAKGHYDPDVARQRVRAVLEGDPDSAIAPIAYRPFEGRFFAPIAPFCHRPRPRLLAAVRYGGPILVTVRKDRGKLPWNHFGVVSAIPDNCFLSTRSSCRTRAFPARDPDGKDNLDPEVLASFAARLDGPPTTRQVMAYVLAVLASADYRERFDPLLKLSYPRVPPPTDEAVFRAVAMAGEALFSAFLTDGTIAGNAMEADTEEPVSVGHHGRRGAALAAAIRGAGAAVAPLLGPD